MPFPVLVLRGVIGLVVLLGIAYLFSVDRKNINWRIVGSGVALQIVFALIVLKTGVGQTVFSFLAAVFAGILNFTYAGTAFIFGQELGTPEGGVIFAFHVLPTIIFFASLMGVLYYLGLIQPVVNGMGRMIQRVMRISGAESLATAANVFIGQTEAPLAIRPYIDKMTHSELMTLMTGGMATIAGGVLAAYIIMLGGESEAMRTVFATHLLAASIMSAPAAIATSKILIPETDEPSTTGKVEVEAEGEGENVLEAAAEGAAEGLKLAVNVGAMLLAFIALIALINFILGWLGAPVFFGYQVYDLNALIADVSGGQFDQLSLQSIFGYLFAPIAWAMGVEAADILYFGRLLGEKIAVNEFIAFMSLGQLQGEMNPRSVIMATYALCGFANFSSIAIQIGGIGGLAPERRGEIAGLGLRAILGGALASWMTATVAGVLATDYVLAGMQLGG